MPGSSGSSSQSGRPQAGPRCCGMVGADPASAAASCRAAAPLTRGWMRGSQLPPAHAGRRRIQVQVSNCHFSRPDSSSDPRGRGRGRAALPPPRETSISVTYILVFVTKQQQQQIIIMIVTIISTFFSSGLFHPQSPANKAWRRKRTSGSWAEGDGEEHCGEARGQ